MKVTQELTTLSHFMSQVLKYFPNYVLNNHLPPLRIRQSVLSLPIQQNGKIGTICHMVSHQWMGDQAIALFIANPFSYSAHFGHLDQNILTKNSMSW